MQLELYIVLPMVILFVGLSYALGWYVSSKTGKNKIASAEERARQILLDAEKNAEALKKEKLLEVKDEWYKRKQEYEHEVAAKRSKLQAFEKQLNAREENLERKVEFLNKKEKELQNSRRALEERIKNVEEKNVHVQRLIHEQTERLEKIAGMSKEEAKMALIETLIDQAKAEAAPAIKEIRDGMRLEAKKEAQKIIVQAIQRLAADLSVENSVSVLHLENDELKGRIIGKEGRNIRSFEASTGVDVIVDDTPEAVILSAFDPLRREVAKIALERLIQDGRIHPARIEEVVEKVRKEIDEEILQTGENALLECGLHGGHKEVIKHIGLMKYRSSYGQNLLSHSIEVAYLTGLMAAELGFDTMISIR